MKNRSNAVKGFYRLQPLPGLIFNIMLFFFPTFLWCQPQIFTTIPGVPDQLYKPSGASTFTYCVTIIGNGNGNDWSLGTGFYMTRLTTDGPDTNGDGVGEGMAITAENSNSCTIEYTPTVTGPGNGNLEIIYTNTGTGLNDVLTIPITINAAGTPAALNVVSANLGSLSPTSAISHMFSLDGGVGEYMPSVASPWTITQSQTDRREFTLLHPVPVPPGPIDLSVSFTPLCGGTPTTLDFTGTVVAPATDVRITITPSGTITLPRAMVNQPYPPAGVSLPTLQAIGGSRGDGGGNSYNWSIDPPVRDWLQISPNSNVAEVASVGFSTTNRPTASGTLSVGVRARDVASYREGMTSLSLEVLPELTITLTPSSSSMFCPSGGGICYNRPISAAISSSSPESICNIEINNTSAEYSVVEATSENPFILPSWLEIRPPSPSSSTAYTLNRTGSPSSGDMLEFRIRFTVAGYSTISAPIRININRQPADIVFVLDKSGSMRSRAVSSRENTNTRWFYLEEAMQILNLLIRDQSLLDMNDRVGAVFFSSRIEVPNSLAAYSNDLLQAINDNIDEARPGGSTGMGAGLVAALRGLCRDCPDSRCGTSEGSCDNHKKIIVLFTDGDQNLNPALYTTPTRARINSTEFPSFRNTIIPADINDWFINNQSSNIDLTSDDFSSDDYQIFTIALDGVTPTNASMHERLRIISNITNGEHDAIISHLEEGTRFTGFSPEFTNTLTGVLRGGSPQILDNRKRRLSSSGLGEETFQINDRVKGLSFVVTSNRNIMQRLQIRVFKGAQEFLPSQPFIKVTKGETYTVFSISFKDSTIQQSIDLMGTWSVRIGGQADDYFQITAIVDEHFFDYECFMQKSVVLAGEGLDFVANVDYSGAFVPNLNITAQILGPGEDLPTLISNTPTPAAIRPWLQSDYTWNLELYNKLGISQEGTAPDRDFTLSGRATDSKGAPISNAVITVIGKDIKTTTDKNGAYILSKIRLGDRLSLSKDNNVLKEILITSAALLTGQLLVDFLVGSTPERVDTILANIIRIDPDISPAEAKVEYLRRSGLFDFKINLQPNVYQLIYRGNGRYSVPYPGSSNTITGSHNILYRIEGEIPGVGAIQRYTTNSAVVKFGLLDLRASFLEFLSENTVNGLTFGKLIIKPVDQFGHLIGLNRGFNIEVTSSGNPSFKLGPFVDRLDGSYVFPVSYNLSNGTPQIKIVVDEQTISLYEGSIDEIPKAQEKENFKLPFALGVAIPLGNSATAYDPGVMAELKFGIPLSKNKKLNLNLEAGFYSFDQKPQTDAFQIWGAAIGLRYDIKSVLGGTVFVDANPLGFYKPISQKGAYGLNFGTGIFWNVFTPKLSIGLDGSYYSIFANPETITFLGLGAGIRINLFN